jgi:hypothetical protein
MVNKVGFSRMGCIWDYVFIYFYYPSPPVFLILTQRPKLISIGLNPKGKKQQDEQTGLYRTFVMQIISKCVQLDFLEAEGLVLSVKSNRKINACLKELVDFSGIAKNLSYHIARHTFATTFTMMNGLPIESVSKMLGHKNITRVLKYPVF